MGIKSENGFVFFNEMLYRCMRRKYGSFKISKKMQIFELGTQFEIYLKTLAMQKKSQKKLKNDEIFKSIIKKENGVNPFLTNMNFKISFKTWIKFAKSKLRLKAYEMLVASGNQDAINKDAIGEVKRKIFPVQIEQDEYYSVTSEEDVEELKKGTNSSEARKELKSPDSHLRRYHRAMTNKIKQNSDTSSPAKDTRGFNSSAKSQQLMSLRVSPLSGFKGRKDRFPSPFTDAVQTPQPKGTRKKY